jgi:hypothetical protein
MATEVLGFEFRSLRCGVQAFIHSAVHLIRRCFLRDFKPSYYMVLFKISFTCAKPEREVKMTWTEVKPAFISGDFHACSDILSN